jgi:DTW domain-containing protein YfiP
MNLESYRHQQELQKLQAQKTRHLCVKCLQPEFGCYCLHIKPFDPKIKFVILIHPIEMKRRIATGRMSHLSLKNSELIVGQDYTDNKRVDELIQDPRSQPLVLYPGLQSTNLSETSSTERSDLVKKRLLIFVIDGTWATARKTMHLSQNLKKVPRIGFTPPSQSQFRVRKQPGVDCYSTIEAIHHTIELLGPAAGFNIADGEHNSLLNVFNKMVERQLDFIRAAYDNPELSTYRRPRKRIA